MGLYDIPAVIDFILLKTGQDCLSYIGHSMGTTMFYAMMSLRPEFNRKIAGQISLAPIAYVSRMTSIVRYLSPVSAELEVLLKYFTNGEILSHTPLVNTALKLTCDPYIVHPGLCQYIMGLLFGSDPLQMKKSVLSAFMGHNPAGVSFRVLVHYGQLIKSRKFRQYDYGKVNSDRYNATEPPEYNISAVSTKVALFYSTNDALSVEQDVKDFYPRLPNPIGLFRVNYSTFNHLDFIVAKDARPLLYEDLLDVLAAFDSGDTLDVTNRKSVIPAMISMSTSERTEN
uniref:Gastric triacylglycerol lipase n=1 Tax=Cacopsylla melanoneura TaxID=428564 RepID=A0A8D8Z5Q4_9HEMI